MTERERLIELLNQKYDHFCDQCGINKDSRYTDSLADYLLANGVIASGCKVGDSLYKPKKVGARWVVVEYVITTIMSIEKNKWIIRYRKDRGHTHHQCNIDDIGETVFLSREEAEQALRKEDEGK